jgi:iron complex transport system permease protein
MKHPMIKTAAVVLPLLAAAAVASVCLGTYTVSPAETLSILAGSPSPFSDIILHLRIPRTLAAFTAGASLSVSGVLFQSLLKNPLADPYTLGVSGGASFGAALAIVTGLSYPFAASSALAGALITALLIFVFSRSLNADRTSLILGGVAAGIFFSSAVMLLFSLADSMRVHKALMWLMGDMSLARTEYLAPTGAACALLVISSFFFSHKLNLLSYGQQYAHAAGVSRADSAAVFWIATALAAFSVAMCGIVSFIGLIVPHIVRRFTGPDHRILIPAAALAGGAFLPICDSVGRLLARPYEIPSGVITGFAGGIFLLLILKRR